MAFAHTQQRHIPSQSRGGMGDRPRNASSGLSTRALAQCKRHIPTVIAVIVLLVAWEAWVHLSNVPPTMISSPSEILEAMISTWPTLGPAAAVTGFEGVVGFLFAVFFGILIGVAFYCSRTLNAAFYPLLGAAQTMPLISIAPLFLIWFGFEIKLRVAARQIYGGIRVSVAYIFATASTAEYLGARKGMGIWLQAAYNSFRTPLVFAATVVIVLMTAILLAVVNLSERVLLGPADDAEDPDADQ